jgi:hypothetical protein
MTAQIPTRRNASGKAAAANSPPYRVSSCDSLAPIRLLARPFTGLSPRDAFRWSAPRSFARRVGAMGLTTRSTTRRAGRTRYQGSTSTVRDHPPAPGGPPGYPRNEKIVRRGPPAGSQRHKNTTPHTRAPHENKESRPSVQPLLDRGHLSFETTCLKGFAARINFAPISSRLARSARVGYPQIGVRCSCPSASGEGPTFTPSIAWAVSHLIPCSCALVATV